MTTATLSTSEVADEVGASYRQIDYWMRIGVLPVEDPASRAPGCGNRRRWTRQQVDQVKVAKRLYDHGATHQVATEAVRSVGELIAREGLTGMVYVDQHGRASRIPSTGWSIDLAAL